ncbi:hypothetical protein KDD17_01330 [Sulfitobacter albidus]|uniref:Uncharacterized protein n=1 Tax=Sulfitobacter albidus TaxID=2829501 RepID=A0A975JEE1_9RHOB|nr:hypothetical protein [Sulfitobacter albidus]QUJ76735.1 hypothetical protein KDD17_01330 [Sulfitobacter albidus]
MSTSSQEAIALDVIAYKNRASRKAKYVRFCAVFAFALKYNNLFLSIPLFLRRSKRISAAAKVGFAQKEPKRTHVFAKNVRFCGYTFLPHRNRLTIWFRP